ncbi:MAG: CAP domain-containing protein, partial [Acidimicrobiales bacterium]
MVVLRRTLGVLMLIPLLHLSGGGTAQAESVDAENEFVARIAEERASEGLGALAHADDLQAVARRHAQRMADRGEPYHNPDLATEVGDAAIIAENVGRGMSVDGLHRAFMNSTTHRDVILHPDLTQLGVGVVTTDEGEIFVVEVFRRPRDTAPPPAEPAPASAPAGPAPPSASAPPSPAPASTVAVAPPPTVPVTSAPTTTTSVTPPSTVATAST